MSIARRSTPAPSAAQQKYARRARKIGLRYVHDDEPGITRRRCGRGFTYVLPTGRVLKSERIRSRIEQLAIPPAWGEVWICRRANGHLQATGLDAARRKQYRYHPEWEAVSAATKYDRLHFIADVLPRIRRRVRKDLRGKSLSRERVLAAVVRLLDKAHVRVGNTRYLEQHGSRGATTLTDEHVDVDGFSISLHFPGKSGQEQEIAFRDPKTAQVVRQCESIDGQFLFCYRNDSREYTPVDSTAVNSYLQEISGASMTAKDFRTWWGTVAALSNLCDAELAESKAARKRTINAAVAFAAEELGNTSAVCRSHYIHPGMLSAYETGELPQLLRQTQRQHRRMAELTQDERMLALLLPRLEFS
ncbi:MAG: DNA topoisomerase [Planctomyces sp.]|nr:DNA topoisomerase [Planctomyces sp.]